MPVDIGARCGLHSRQCEGDTMIGLWVALVGSPAWSGVVAGDADGLDEVYRPLTGGGFGRCSRLSGS